MDKEKSGNTKNPQGMSDTDKEYYEDLYQDLPKEVVDILMQTHPLMGKNNDDKEATAYRTRHPQRGDVEEIREARMQQIGSELSEMRKAPQQEGEPTKYVSRRARNAEPVSAESANAEPIKEKVNKKQPAAHTMEEDEREIQYVSMMPAKKKSHITEEVTMQSVSYTPTPKRKKRSRQEEMPFSETYAGERPRYEDMDFAERAKQEHLDNLYDEYEDDYEEYRGKRSKIPFIAGIVGVIVIVVLLFQCINLNSALRDAKMEVQHMNEINEKYEQIQIEKMQLQEELDKLKDPEGAKKAEEKKKADAEKKKEEKKNKADAENKDTKKKEGTASGAKEHIVKENETPWTIAVKYYGNGTEYTKILEANGLTEQDNIRPGTKLKIPAA